ncbi:hypothetical protein NLU13_0203 [Sarocladium strictum]|uniref:Uncharacterized protein n=1 Tax=Sarocladium strictum TaxID=5046 RepID=A0AA39GNL9_SARSR|nr:hypothetical protein NLU13_0203 [Sarocladium strictum]
MMATLEAPIAVQLPPKGVVFEAADRVVSSSGSIRDDGLPRSGLSLPAQTSNHTPSSASEKKTTAARNRWRPRNHLMPPTGWLNDPCAPGYDPVHDVYHLGFQWNPAAPQWGDIAWGTAQSKDLLFWETGNAPSIKPSTKHAGEAGVFTGCWSPVSALPGHNTTFYTSARILPIHHTLPYNWGSEAICVATSVDCGRSWQRMREATVLPGPPRHLEVTGWRDPYVATWPALSRALGFESETGLFGIVSGGIRGKGPAVFIYSIDSDNVLAWEFQGLLSPAPTMPQLGSSPWEPDYGANWEVVNYLSLPDPDNPRATYDILIIGVEGRKLEPSTTSGRYIHSDFRQDHRQMWLCGSLVKDSANVHMNFRCGGALDYGGIYAFNSFQDPKSCKQVAFGWIVEEDLSEEQRNLQGWSGFLSIPRIIQLQRLNHVVRALKSDLQAIKNMDVVEEGDRNEQAKPTSVERPPTYTLTTICAVPDPRLVELRKEKRCPEPMPDLGLPGAFGTVHVPLGCPVWEAEMSFDLCTDVGNIGFIIHHSKDGELRTTVSFSPETETLRVVRDKSTSIEDIIVAEEVAPHTLFSMLPSPDTTEASELSTVQETLRFHAFFDASSLELFVNDRTAITTRVYPDTRTCFSIQPFVEMRDERPWTGKLIECAAWELKTSPS